MARRALSLHTLKSFMTSNLEMFEAPQICGIITALVTGSVCMEGRGSGKILLSCLLSFLLLLSLQTIHVALQKVAVSKLELVDVFSVYDCGNFLAFKDCSHQTHKLGRHMRLSCWRDFGILHRNLIRTKKS